MGGSGTTFNQWLVLAVTAASGSAADRPQLVVRIAGARKIDADLVEAAISELAAAAWSCPATTAAPA